MKILFFIELLLIYTLKFDDGINNPLTANENVVKSTYPESLFYYFKEQGYSVNAFHNYSLKYYDRDKIQKNLGVDSFHGKKYSDEDFYQINQETLLKQEISSLIINGNFFENNFANLTEKAKS